MLCSLMGLRHGHSQGDQCTYFFVPKLVEVCLRMNSGKPLRLVMKKKKCLFISSLALKYRNAKDNMQNLYSVAGQSEKLTQEPGFPQ